MDLHFLLGGIEGSFPWVYAVLARLPVDSVRYFFAARQRLAEVS